MFKLPTVFILGAGASWHYGYPTGEDLVALVGQKARELARFFQQSIPIANPYLPGYITRSEDMSVKLSSADHRRLWDNARIEAELLAERLANANPTVIDYFLAQNGDLHAIGKLAIAMVLFDCEAEYANAKGNPNRVATHQRAFEQGVTSPAPHLKPSAFKDDWLRFVLYKLTSQCRSSSDLFENQVTFITFNYNSSLEHRLFNGLRAHSLFDGPDVNKFLEEKRILHVYGQVRERFDDGMAPISTALPNLKPASHIEMDDAMRRLNTIYASSTAIHTIDGEDKEWNATLLERTRDVIRGAHVVYIFGYGFDRLNSSRIGLGALQDNVAHDRTLMFTNFGGHNRVSKSASKLMLPGRDAFVPPAPLIARRDAVVERITRSYTYEMSVKNVYDALDQDFKSLETE